MKIQVSRIPEEGLDIEGEEAFVDEDAGPVTAKVSLRVEKVGEDVLMRGEATAGLRLVCSRCLKEFERDLTVPLDLAFSPEKEMGEEREHELAEEEMSIGFYSEDEIDLAEVVREQMLLNIPMKSLCDEACKGLCPHCGADLNVETCACGTREVDPRLKALEKFFKKGEN
jgi:uncharacterized protein